MLISWCWWCTYHMQSALGLYKSGAVLISGSLRSYSSWNEDSSLSSTILKYILSPLMGYLTHVGVLVIILSMIPALIIGAVPPPHTQCVYVTYSLIDCEVVPWMQVTCHGWVLTACITTVFVNTVLSRVVLTSYCRLSGTVLKFSLFLFPFQC